MSRFSFARLFAMLRKESLQMRRDRGTVGLTVMLPLIQLFLFGYAINANPRHLPTGLMTAEHSTYERTLVTALQNTGYFDIRPMATEAQANEAREHHCPTGGLRHVGRPLQELRIGGRVGHV